MERWGTFAALGLLGACSLLGAVGCDPDDGEDAGAKVESSLEIFSWWIAPGEAEALSALLGVFGEAYPEVTVTNAAALDAETQRSRLRTRLETGEPPDSFQALSGVDLFYWVEQGKMAPLDAMADEEGWLDVFPSPLLDVVRKDGKLYGVPLNIERDNNLYYSIQAFDDAGLKPPQTLEDFHDVCAEFKNQGMDAPLALPAAGWVLALVAFETLMPSVTGGDFYLDYFHGKADPSDPKISAFVDEFAKVIQCSDVDSASDQWGSGGDALYAGNSAMYIMGDWGKAYLEGSQSSDGTVRESPWVADVDFGVVPGLGSEGYFTFNSAVFGLPVGVTHPNAARAFLRVVGSNEGQSAFNPIKGSLPARTDVSLEDYDAMTQRAGKDFVAAASAQHKLLPGYASLTLTDYQNAINPSLLVFALGGTAAQELDKNVSDAELSIEPLDKDYLLGKLAVYYSLLVD